MLSTTKKASVPWLIKHIDELPVELLEGVKVTRVLEGTAFHNIGCEYVVLDKGQVLDSHIHEEASSFILVLEGTGIVEMDGEEVSIRPGHTIYVPAGVSHGFRTIDEVLVLYGFQSPPIIRDAKNVDILFEKKEGQSVLNPMDESY